MSSSPSLSTINPKILALTEDAAAWRRDFHEHPELLYEVHRTASVVAEKLKSFGCDEVATGLGRTGVVGVIKGQAGDRVIGLRADMDALPIHEETNLPYRSKTPGLMHACGHDGHSAMLLGAARYFCETRDFPGTVVVIFQPAEEGGAGAKAMIDDGLMERFGVSEVYGLHNMPGLPLGQFAIRPGPMLAAVDRFSIKIEGRGGHAAKPYQCIDPILVASHITTALQSIVARNIDPLDSAVVSVTGIHAGEAFNVIPQSAEVRGTVRSLRAETRDLCERRFHRLVTQVADAFEAKVTIDYDKGYPLTRNHEAEAIKAGDAAAYVVGEANLNRSVNPSMGGEDFAFMLMERPGAFIFMGNGDSAGLHHPAFDFNDAAIPYGIAYWARLVEGAA